MQLFRRPAGRRAQVNWEMPKDCVGSPDVIDEETQLSVFPFPRITETKKEIDRSRRVEVDGIDGWRLTPVVRFISDNLVLRRAWSPEVDAKRTVQDIVEESVSQAEQRTTLGKAIWTLEEFGQTMNLEALRRADELFTEVCRLEAPQGIRHTAVGVRALLAVAELAFETERPPTMEDAKAIFELMAECQIYKGIQPTRPIGALFGIEEHRHRSPLPGNPTEDKPTMPHNTDAVASEESLL